MTDEWDDWGGFWAWRNDVCVYVFMRERGFELNMYIGKGKVEEFEEGNG